MHIQRTTQQGRKEQFVHVTPDKALQIAPYNLAIYAFRPGIKKKKTKERNVPVEKEVALHKVVETPNV